MGYDIGSGSVGALGGAATGALSGAAIGSVVPVVGTGIGALVGGLGGALFGSSTGFTGSNSANALSMEDAYNLEMYNTAKDLYMMHQQNQYNTSNMRLSNDLAKELQSQQFEHNKWFVQNAYQNTVNDLRKA